MLRTALFAVALALPGLPALAAPVPGLVPGATVASFEATGLPGAPDFRLTYLEFGIGADLQSLSDTPQSGGGPLTLNIQLNWDVADPIGSVGGFFSVFDGTMETLAGTATAIGFTPGAIEVLFDTAGSDILATYDFLDGGAEGAADPFAALSAAGDFTYHSARITLTEVAPIPLPAALPLLLAGMGALVALRRRRA